MAVCENEGNVSQDANFRRHLDNNWDSINREFENVWSQVNSWQGMLTDLQSRVSTLENENLQREQEIIGLRNEITDFENQVDDKIKALDQNYNSRLQKLEKAVFGLGEFEINYDQPPANNKPDYEVNRGFQKRVPASHELNYSTVNGKHRFIEIDTEHDHSLQKDQSLKGDKI